MVHAKKDYYIGISQIKVGITNVNNEIKYKTLDELQPNHWTKAYSNIEFCE
ncbi:hypothetical protein GCM10010896_14140 [Mammaliicoccus stepanovicii]|nr:hypothetical protein GCM10010896_14140 [Mammaliicoccus stepanovicii]